MLEDYTIGLIVPLSGLSDHQSACLREVLIEHRKAVRGRLLLKIPAFRACDPLDAGWLAWLREKMHCEVEVRVVGKGVQEERIRLFLQDADEIYGFPAAARSKLRPDRVWAAYNWATAKRQGWMKIVQPWLSTSTGADIRH
jgi:hypothetical protein